MFEFTDKLKKICFGLMGIGLIAFILGLIVYHEESSRIWSNILLNNMFFLSLSLTPVFFVAINTVGNGSWHVVLKRIPEAMGAFMPVVFVLMLVLALFGLHDVYEWSHETTDPLIVGKSSYLNAGFFIGRIIIYFALWIGLWYMLLKISIEEDLSNNTSYFKKSNIISAIFLVVFAVSSSTSIWDWIMSLDPHWYSTMMGWYGFSSMFVTALAGITLIVLYLKMNGYLKEVNDNHLHDLGKYMFAFSIFWAYLGFCQFMLIWYANIPEETIFFKERFESYGLLYAITFLINFIMPFFIFMTRGSKRHYNTLIFVAIMLLLGHWLDFFLMIYPSVANHMAGHAHWYPGFFELGLLAGYLGLFIFAVFTVLSKINLVPKNHPYLEESIHHNI